MAGRLDRLAVPHERRIEVLRVDDVEPADVLLRLNERPVGHDRVAIVRADDGRGVGAMQRATEDERTGCVQYTVEDEVSGAPTTPEKMQTFMERVIALNS